VKILVLRYSSIGDIVLTTPVFRCIYNQIPNVEIHFATKVQFQSILEFNPFISGHHFLGSSLSDHVNSLKSERFDFVIDLHNNLRTKIIKLQLGIKSVSFDKLNFSKYLLVNFKINRLPAIHIVDRYLAAAKSLGVINDDRGLDYHLPPQFDWETVKAKLPNHKPFTVLVLGANLITKKLTLNKIEELLNHLDGEVVLLGGQNEVAEAQVINSQSFSKVTLINLVGQCSLHESAAVISLASRVITNDTGLMHIAAAFKKPTYVFWGNTVPAFGMEPYLTWHKNLEVGGLSCRPCSKIGFSTCPKGHFKCMNDQTIKAIPSRIME